MQIIRTAYMLIMNALSTFLLRRKHFGALRFWLLKWLYAINPMLPNTRSLRWDFVLQYLPQLKMTHWRGFSVLEIGCTDSLLLYEIRRRHYRSFGMDIRDYNSKLPNDIEFFKQDILEDNLSEKIPNRFHYIIALSTLELLGCGLYGEKKIEGADRKALENIYNLLLDNGYFIMSLPIIHWRNKNSRGYSYLQFAKLIHGLFYVCEATQLGGHICAALVKVPRKKIEK